MTFFFLFIIFQAVFCGVYHTRSNCIDNDNTITEVFMDMSDDVTVFVLLSNIIDDIHWV